MVIKKTVARIPLPAVLPLVEEVSADVQSIAVDLCRASVHSSLTFLNFCLLRYPAVFLISSIFLFLRSSQEGSKGILLREWKFGR